LFGIRERALMVESIETGLVDMRQAHQTQLDALQTELKECQSQLADTKRRCDQYADAAQVRYFDSSNEVLMV
jgi:Skp family chaperone for outer membrane proteins